REETEGAEWRRIGKRAYSPDKYSGPQQIKIFSGQRPQRQPEQKHNPYRQGRRQAQIQQCHQPSPHVASPSPFFCTFPPEAPELFSLLSSISRFSSSASSSVIFFSPRKAATNRGRERSNHFSTTAWLSYRCTSSRFTSDVTT